MASFSATGSHARTGTLTRVAPSTTGPSVWVQSAWLLVAALDAQTSNNAPLPLDQSTSPVPTSSPHWSVIVGMASLGDCPPWLVCMVAALVLAASLACCRLNRSNGGACPWNGDAVGHDPVSVYLHQLDQRVGQLGSWLSSLIGGAHPLGLRALVAQHHIREVGATRKSTLWVSAHSPHLPAHRSGGAVSDGKLRRRQPPLRSTAGRHCTAQRRRLHLHRRRSPSTSLAPVGDFCFPLCYSSNTMFYLHCWRLLPTDLHLVDHQDLTMVSDASLVCRLSFGGRKRRHRGSATTFSAATGEGEGSRRSLWRRNRDSERKTFDENRRSK
jgi:hypothetical protein